MRRYVLVFGVYLLVLAVLQLLLGWFTLYNDILGTWAMGVEALLPIPQLLTNQRRKSLSGFQLSVLAGWTFGDLFKTVYYIWRSAPLQFTIFGAFQLCVDLAICAQAYFFYPQTKSDDAALAAQQENRGTPAERPSSPAARGPSPQRPPEDELELLPADISDDENTAKKAATPRAPLGSSQPFEVGDIEADEDEA